MNFSDNEKLAINYFIIKLMRMDNHTDFQEAVALFDICNAIGISMNQTSTSLQLEENEAINIIKEMDENKRLEVLQLLKKMANADGEFIPTEKELIIKIFA